MTEISETEIKSMTKEQNYMRGYEDGKSDVLDKIRDEIEQAKTIEIKMGDTAFKVSTDVVINPQYRNFTSGLDIALQVIDKYKTK